MHAVWQALQDTSHHPSLQECCWGCGMRALLIPACESAAEECGMHYGFLQFCLLPGLPECCCEVWQAPWGSVCLFAAHWSLLTRGRLGGEIYYIACKVKRGSVYGAPSHFEFGKTESHFGFGKTEDGKLFNLHQSLTTQIQLLLSTKPRMRMFVHWHADWCLVQDSHRSVYCHEV